MPFQEKIMGNLTTHTLYSNNHEAIDRYKKMADEQLFEYVIVDDQTDGVFCFIGKWDNYKGLLVNLSLEYPDTLFTLHGEGEDTNDIWNFYVRNGLSQFEKAIITIPDFDETKLKYNKNYEYENKI